MAESPRSADVRLTIPADAPYPEMAGDIAGKFAEYLGAPADAAKRLAASVQALAARLANGRAGKVPAAENVVSLTLEARDRRICVTASAGDRHEHADFTL